MIGSLVLLGVRHVYRTDVCIETHVCVIANVAVGLGVLNLFAIAPSYQLSTAAKFFLVVFAADHHTSLV